MLDVISLDDLTKATGGAGPIRAWEDVRTAAAPHCPNTVARFPAAPTTRAQAQVIGNACLAEMGPLKTAFGGRSQIQAGIDAAFPR